ncbi:MAG: histidinol-phosphate transaminase [Anaerolineae bacterium]|nr:histidinol-phosphate transaminase [Thermoflexales bacterium]MDW8408740.1 histidinol-phosphate transaminase [Anaerolineae bacterium]
MDIESLISPHLRAMQPYTPIAPFEVLARRLGRDPSQIVKLDANENLYGPSPRALQAIAQCGAFHIYPDPDQTALREAISAYINVPAAQVLCGAGADEVIDLLTRAFVQPGDVVIDLPPTFGMYRFESDVVNARYIAVPRRPDFSVDVDAVCAAVMDMQSAGQTPKLLFLSNPNNPDGSLIDEDDLRRLLELPLVVVLDEAYIDFSGRPSCAAWVCEWDNLVVLRTFSKLAGLAGLRVGYGVFPLQIIRHLWKIKQPYTPNVAASVAAIAALSDPDYLRDTVQRIVAERERLKGALKEVGWLHVYPSHTNFVLCRVDRTRAPDTLLRSSEPIGKVLKQALQDRGVLVRYFDKDGLRDCVRVSVGKPEHTEALLNALRDIAA